MSTDKAVFNDLDPDDKQEFKDYEGALRKRKLRIVRAKIRKRPFAAPKRQPWRRVRRRLAPPAPAGPAVPAPGEPEAPEPAAAAPLDPGDEARRNRGPNVLPHEVQWIDVQCRGCGQVAGSYKLYDHDQVHAPYWLFRCIEPETGLMGTKYPYRRQKVRTKMREEHVVEWIEREARCCVRPN